MAVSFSAEYLYQGAKILSRSPVVADMGGEDAFQYPEALFALARAVYSLGVFVIAPIGMLYHSCAAGAHFGRTFFAEEREVAPINQLVEQHWEAVGHDGMAFMTSCTVLMVTVALALAVLFGVRDPDMIMLIIMCIIYPIAGIASGEPAGNFFLQYGYAASPAHFVNFLSREQQQIYVAYYVYKKLVQQGVAIDEPLSAQEILGINESTRAAVRSPVAGVVSIYQSLLRFNKVTPTHRARLQAFVDRAPEMQRGWDSALAASLEQPEDERNAFLASNMTERMQRITATLPPIGDPAPAALRNARV